MSLKPKFVFPLFMSSKSILSKCAFTAFLAAIFAGMTGCPDGISITGQEILRSIQVTSPPDKVTYALGEPLALTGIEVTGTYSVTIKKRMDSWDASNISGYNSMVKGPQLVTITIDGKTATFTVAVTDAILEKIEIIKPPDKVIYANGEKIDLTGIVIVGTYSDGRTEIEKTEGIFTSVYDPNLEEIQTITVTVEGMTADFNIMLTKAALTGIDILKLPDKLEYALGEKLDLTGIIAEKIFTDGTRMEFTPELSYISGYNPDIKGEQTLTLTFEGKTADFAITMEEGFLTAIEVIGGVFKTHYPKGLKVDLEGIQVMKTYSTGGQDVIGFKNLNVEPEICDMEPGEYDFTISVKGSDPSVTTKIKITVLDAVLAEIKFDENFKTKYVVGDVLDLGSFNVIGIYTDGTEHSLNSGGLTIQIGGYVIGTPSETFNSEGTYKLTVTANNTDISAGTNLTVDLLKLEGLTVTPKKLEYSLADLNNNSLLACIEAVGHYNNGSTKSFPGNLDLKILHEGAWEAGTQTVTVGVTGEEPTYSFVIVVIDKSGPVKSMTVIKPPDKTTYTTGEIGEEGTLDLSGLELALVYENNEVEIISYPAGGGGNDKIECRWNGDSELPPQPGKYEISVRWKDDPLIFANFSITVKTGEGAIDFGGDLTVGSDIYDPPYTLRKTSNPNSMTLTITSGVYDEYKWFLNDDEIDGSSSNYTVSAADCFLGSNILRVEARKGSVWYDAEIEFTVEK
ncbi:MAG: bacterial Ig-like domain-containing protein [Treponema sp.]|jgi:hypothetical protein|nr:bacterial Ig-like domain-containing protein [Treponema sp.]